MLTDMVSATRTTCTLLAYGMQLIGIQHSMPSYGLELLEGCVWAHLTAINAHDEEQRSVSPVDHLVVALLHK